MGAAEIDCEVCESVLLFGAAGTCVDQNGTLVCLCPEHFSGDGKKLLGCIDLICVI